ncbi:MAG: T9SS type A sorting domain-containing protein [Flavobacteriales bacterium]|nr:T9SS type A sorting domain-containing protein [Flavobacteriales bacterium]
MFFSDSGIHSPKITEPLTKPHFMKRIFGTLMIFLVSVGSQAQTMVTDQLVDANEAFSYSKASAGINIYPSIVNDILNIDVDEHVIGNITVSVFNSLGKIVVEQTLNTGSNAIDTNFLLAGEYVAVVRKNEIFQEKLRFEVK